MSQPCKEIEFTPFKDRVMVTRTLEDGTVLIQFMTLDEWQRLQMAVAFAK